MEGWQQHQETTSQGSWPCELIHFKFREVCTGADFLTLLDLLDHVRVGYFSVVCLVPPDDPEQQQSSSCKSKPPGLDGFPPKENRIAKSFRHHAELTARFTQQALLCPAHKVATVLIISEPIGRSSAAVPSSLWLMKELQTLEGLDDAHRGTGFLCQLGSAEHGHAMGVLSNLSSLSSALHKGWPHLQPASDDGSVLVYRGPLSTAVPVHATADPH